MEDKCCIKELKTDNVIRFVTFNVNGIRTLFHYQPFTQSKGSLKTTLDYFGADIVTFQELKIERSTIGKWGNINGFQSFVSIPKKKKGYSGVGCWIKQYPTNHPLHALLKVTKAEEGITGCLTVNVSKQACRYRDDTSHGIGGYDDLDIDDQEALNLDSEGRCVIVELACNIVVISVYCPANSGATEEGQTFRMRYLTVLFKRVHNLINIGKKVVLMGDINICRDLIDHAEALEMNSIGILPSVTGSEIETQFPEQCRKFIMNNDTPQRRLLNSYLVDSFIPDFSQKGTLIDTTRLVQTKRRLKMYTVWNTLKNSRPVNYGSRIDFIFTDYSLKSNVSGADILPDVMGSDHCPVYLDLSIDKLTFDESVLKAATPKFEAKNYYNLLNKNILDLFASRKKPQVCDAEQIMAVKEKSASIDATSKIPSFTEFSVTKRKPHCKTKIGHFFKPTKVSESIKEGAEDILKRMTQESAIKSDTISTRVQSKLSLGDKKVPICKHGLECILRTSKTESNYGKRFWTCSKPKGDSKDIESACGFFQWM